MAKEWADMSEAEQAAANFPKIVAAIGTPAFPIGGTVTVAQATGIVDIGSVGGVREYLVMDDNDAHELHVVRRPDPDDQWLYVVRFPSGETAGFMAHELRAGNVEIKG